MIVLGAGPPSSVGRTPNISNNNSIKEPIHFVYPVASLVSVLAKNVLRMFYWLVHKLNDFPHHLDSPPLIPRGSPLLCLIEFHRPVLDV